jgi:sRNA-binding regulator protein Hfq
MTSKVVLPGMADISTPQRSADPVASSKAHIFKNRGDRTVNRKLIRPKLTDIKEQGGGKPTRRKPVPPEQTNAESFYYIKQMNSKTPMVVILKDGEEIHGVIEWYDKNCLKVNRTDKPNLLLMKHTIKYMYKENEEEDE